MLSGRSYYLQSRVKRKENRFFWTSSKIFASESFVLQRKVKFNVYFTRYRKCSDTQVFVKDGWTHCIDTCNEKTMCGEVEVPEDHLDACRTCNATGQNCGIAIGSTPGPGIPDFDFIFYVSAMQTERCNKSLTVAYAAHCQQESALDRWVAQWKSWPIQDETLVGIGQTMIVTIYGYCRIFRSSLLFLTENPV